MYPLYKYTTLKTSFIGVLEAMDILFFLLTCLCFFTPSMSQILRFQLGKNDQYSIEEWAMFNKKLPNLKSFTACQWTKLRFFSTRDTSIWACCYKKKNLEWDHSCLQFWYNRDPASAGRFIIASGGFGDNSYGG